MISVKCSVKTIVEWICRYGDINYVGSDSTAMEQGSVSHREIQKIHKEMFENYKREVALSTVAVCDGFEITVGGRADGVYSNENGIWIEEIKCSLVSLDYLYTQYLVHLAQAKFYAYMYAQKNETNESINTVIVYLSLSTNEIKYERNTHTVKELEEFFNSVIERYTEFLKMQHYWKEVRDPSIKEVKFPFTKLRAGQKTMMTNVYNTVLDDNRLFINAPTGIGKTLSGIYPAVKSMLACELNKIFYLTAKTITGTVAMEAFSLLAEQGLRFKVLSMTAKERLCMCEKMNCTPEECKYAKGHYDRINQVILNIFEEQNIFNKANLEEYAKKYTVCPYELAGDLSLFSDAIICDYNYVFDPNIYLKRFFRYNSNNDYVFLIDEAHNLPDRVREMFSAQIHLRSFTALYKMLKGRNNPLKHAANNIIKYLKLKKEECKEKFVTYIQNSPFNLILQELVIKFIQEFDIFLKEGAVIEDMETALEPYFQALRFNLISAFYDEKFTTYVDMSDSVVERIFCIDTSRLISEALKRAKSAVMFSATLSPMTYYKYLMGGEEEKTLELPSPFDPGNLCLMINSKVSVKYADRKASIEPICDCIYKTAATRTGNYIAYFPSYGYMNEVYEFFLQKYPDTKTTIQKNVMSVEERQAFLDSFESGVNETMIGFCVLGGMFAEGVDLTGDRLIGAIIVGVGLPGLSAPQDIIRDYFNETNSCGYEYAYMYPGFNKVLQACGRVIRTADDRGIVLLIDTRFAHSSYRELFPAHWNERKYVRDSRDIQRLCADFWRRG